MAILTILDVGHGNASILHKANRALIVDAGPGTGLLEFLRENGITEVVAVLISHADTDHLKGLVGLLGQDDITIRAVYVNSDSAKASRQWRALAFELDERELAGDIRFEVGLRAGMRFELESSAALDVVGPRPALVMLGPGGSDDEGRRIKTNTISAVIRVTVEDETVALLPGDLDEVGLEHLLAVGDSLDCRVLVYPHHGGNVDPGATTTRNREFARRLLAATHPEVVLFSMGRNRFSNPRAEVVEEVRRLQATHVMCTQMARQCAPEIVPGDPSHLSASFAAGRRRGICCAGSISISDGTMSPTREVHEAFVTLAAPNALCRHEALNST